MLPQLAKAIAASVLLAACGGGDPSTDPSTEEGVNPPSSGGLIHPGSPIDPSPGLPSAPAPAPSPAPTPVPTPFPTPGLSLDSSPSPVVLLPQQEGS